MLDIVLHLRIFCKAASFPSVYIPVPSVIPTLLLSFPRKRESSSDLSFRVRQPADEKSGLLFSQKKYKLSPSVEIENPEARMTVQQIERTPKTVLFERLVNMIARHRPYLHELETIWFREYCPDGKPREVRVFPANKESSLARIVNAELLLLPDDAWRQVLLVSTEGRMILCSYSPAEMEFQFLSESEARARILIGITDEMLGNMSMDFRREVEKLESKYRHKVEELRLLRTSSNNTSYSRVWKD